MEEAALARGALHDAVSDIDPPPFRESLESIIEDAVLTPAVLTVRTATAVAGTVDREAARSRGAGVQLCYEGLRASRTLTVDDPWTHTGEAVTEEDIQVIAAGTMVARGFQFLAHSGVARDGIEVMRRFGRNRTNELQDVPPPHPSLEIEVIKLAIEAGADLALSSVPAELSEYAEAVARDLESDPLPAPETVDVDIETELQRLLVSQPTVSPREVYHSSTET